MNYLVAVDIFFPDRQSGSARVAWDVARAMRDDGNNVAVLCRKQQPDAEDVSECEGVRVVRFAVPKAVFLNLFKLYKQRTAGIEAASKYLADTNWHLIHIHNALYGPIVYEIFGSGPRYVFTAHSPCIMDVDVNWAARGLVGKIKLLFGKSSIRKTEGGTLHRVDAIQALSNFTKETIDKYYGVADKTTVIPHWCADGFSRQRSKAQALGELGWPKGAKILLTACRLSAGKGVDVALKAAGPLLKSRSELCFAIAGDGYMKQQLEKLTESLGIADKIWFLGHLTDLNLRRCYEAADLLLIPTQEHECFGLPVLEGLAYGLPIISTDAGALPELVEPILPQCIVPAGRIEPMRKKISDCIDGRLDLPSSQVLTEYVRNNFSRSVIFEKLKTLF